MQTSLQATEQLEEKKKIRNWTWPSLLVAFFMFFPAGIPAFVYAILSRRKLKKNNIEGAKKAAKIARILTLTGLVLGTVILIAEAIYYLNTGKTFEYLWFV